MMPLMVTYWLEFITILIAAAAALLAGFLLAGHEKRVGFAAAIFGLLLLLSINAAYLFPQLYFFPQPLPITEDLLIAGGALLLGVALRLATVRSSGRILATVLAILGTFYILHQPVSRLFVGKRYAAIDQQPTLLSLHQTTPQTCVPACCAALLAHLGIAATEGEMALRCRTSFFGSTWADAIRALTEAARARQVDVSCRIQGGLTPAQLHDVSPPGILDVTVAGRGHVILFLGTESSPTLSIRIADPLDGRPRQIQPRELLDEYEWRGNLLTVRRVND